MYGTIFRMRVKRGHEAGAAKAFEDWERELKPKIEGAIESLVMRPDGKPGELIGVAVFKDEASYRANADSPDQDRWYRALREHLEADPEWEDGEYIAGSVG